MYPFAMFLILLIEQCAEKSDFQIESFIAAVPPSDLCGSILPDFLISSPLSPNLLLICTFPLHNCNSNPPQPGLNPNFQHPAPHVYDNPPKMI